MGFLDEPDRVKRRTTMKYTCNFHKKPFTFEADVGSSGGFEDSHGRTIKKVSSQVKCPRCGNFLKTWGEGY